MLSESGLDELGSMSLCVDVVLSYWEHLVVSCEFRESVCLCVDVVHRN